MSPPATIGIHYSKGSAIWPFLKGALMASLSAAVAFRLIPDAPESKPVEVIAFLAFAFFSSGAVLGVWPVLTSKGPVVTLTQTGITDLRIAPEEIPWTAIRYVSEWEFRKMRTIALNVDPIFEATMHLKRMVKWVRDSNAGMGVRGLCITTQGLECNHSELAYLIDQRARRAQEPEPKLP